MYAGYAFLPQFLQTPERAGYGFGASVTESGLLLLPQSLATFTSGLLSGRLAARFGSKRLLVTGAALAAVGQLGLAFVHDQPWQVLAASALGGAGFGLAFAAMSNLVVDAVPRSQTGVASGMNANIRTVGGAIGGAVLGSVVTAGARADGLPVEAGYVHGFAVLAGCSLLAATVALLVPAPDRPEPRGARGRGPPPRARRGRGRHPRQRRPVTAPSGRAAAQGRRRQPRARPDRRGRGLPRAGAGRWSRRRRPSGRGRRRDGLPPLPHPRGAARGAAGGPVHRLPGGRRGRARPAGRDRARVLRPGRRRGPGHPARLRRCGCGARPPSRSCAAACTPGSEPSSTTPSAPAPAGDDVTVQDVVGVFVALRGVRETLTSGVALDWRRHLELCLAGLRP